MTRKAAIRVLWDMFHVHDAECDDHSEAEHEAARAELIALDKQTRPGHVVLVLTRAEAMALDHVADHSYTDPDFMRDHLKGPSREAAWRAIHKLVKAAYYGAADKASKPDSRQ